MELKDNFDELYNKVVDGKYICEEIVKQHKDLAAFNSDTLNTCRLYTLLKTDGKAYVTMANSRYGRKGNEVDNFHSGGVSAGIDVETGKVVTDAINRAHMKCVKHPDGRILFMGRSASSSGERSFISGSLYAGVFAPAFATGFVLFAVFLFLSAAAVFVFFFSGICCTSFQNGYTYYIITNYI